MAKVEDFFGTLNTVNDIQDERYSHLEVLKRAIEHVPAEEQAMLLEINEAGFQTFNGTPQLAQ